MRLAMAFRWTVATLAAAVLAWTTITADMPWLDPAFAGRVQPPPGEACPADAAPAPLDFTLHDLEGRAVRLSDYKGQVVLLDFWATWCVPCRVQVPWFVEFQQQYGKDGLQVLGVSVNDPLAALVPYASAMKMNYPVLQGRGHDALFEAYGPMVGIPTTVLISRDGKVCGKHIGAITRQAVEAGITALLDRERA